MLVFVAAAVAGGTGAFFSDTETSTGNVFTAGSVSIEFTGIDQTYGYNDGVDPVDNYFEVSTRDNIPFFTFNDMKPRDAGELSFGLENGANEAFVCGFIGGEAPSENPDLALWENVNFFDTDGDQVLPGTWFDLGTLDPDAGDTYAVDYCFGDWDGTSCDVDPGVDYNAAQNGTFSADLTLFAIQTRNNDGFSCDQLSFNDDDEPVYTPVELPAVGAVLGDYIAPSCDVTVTNSETIQSGVDALNGDGGVVCVEDGTYTEIVSTGGANQSIVAVNPQGATIDGAVKLMFDDNSLQGFRITGTTDTSGVGGNAYGVFLSADDAIVANNEIEGTYESQSNNQGIVTIFGGTDGALIENNSVTGFHSGVYLNPSSNAVVRYNDLFLNTVGLSSDNPVGNIVTLNDIRDNTFEGVGVLVNSGESIAVNQNNITDNFSDNELGSYGTDAPDATNNWWGDLDASDDTDHGTGPVIIEPEAVVVFPTN